MNPKDDDVKHHPEEQEDEADDAYDDAQQDNGLFDEDPTARFIPARGSPRSSLPLDDDDDDNAIAPSSTKRPHQKLTFFSAYALLIGSQIGTGIFASPSQIDQHVASPAAAISVWVVAGLIAWAGAASFAELGAAIPENGGIQQYLHYIYGDALASVMAWTWIVAGKPAAMAIQCIIFAEYWTNTVFSAPDTPAARVVGNILAMACLLAILAVNAVNVDSTTRFTNVLLFVKLGTVMLVILLALLNATLGLGAGVGDDSDDGKRAEDWKSRNWFAARRPGSGGSDIDWSTVGAWESMGSYVAALYAGLWAYGGWDNVNMVAAELKNTSRDLPRAIHTAEPTVIGCYVLINVAYYVLVPWDVLGKSNSIAVTAGTRLLGAPGGYLFAVLVSASCLGALNVNVFTTSRLTVAAAEQGYLPSFLGRSGRGTEREDLTASDAASAAGMETSGAAAVHGRAWLGRGHLGKAFTRITTAVARLRRDLQARKTPVAAIAFNGITTVVYIYLGTFKALLTFIGIAEFTFFLLTTAGIFHLRYRRRPSLVRPYQPFVGIPIVFFGASSFLFVRGVLYAPFQTAILLAVIIFAGAWRILRAKITGERGGAAAAVGPLPGAGVPLRGALPHASLRSGPESMRLVDR